MIAHNKCFDCEGTDCVMNCSGLRPTEKVTADAARPAGLNDAQRGDVQTAIDCVLEKQPPGWPVVVNTLKGILAQPSEAQTADVRTMTDAARDVLAERERQVTAEDWTPEHDDLHTESELALAAACYAMAAGGYAKGQTPPIWPWSLEWWKPVYGRRDLIKAAALILAEIERIDRALLEQKP